MKKCSCILQCKVACLAMISTSSLIHDHTYTLLSYRHRRPAATARAKWKGDYYNAISHQSFRCSTTIHVHDCHNEHKERLPLPRCKRKAYSRGYRQCGVEYSCLHSRAWRWLSSTAAISMNNTLGRFASHVMHGLYR